MKKVFLIFFIIVNLTNCSDNNVVRHKGFSSEYPLIDVGSISGKYQRVYCSDYFSSIELIPLETNDNSIIGIRLLDNLVLVNDSLIFVISEHHTGNIVYSWMPRDLLVFDRSGNFLNQIGRIGQGPRDYLGIQNVYLNIEKPTIFIDDQLSIIEYDFAGKFIDSFRKPNTLGIMTDHSNFVGENLFFGSIGYYATRGNNYFLFDRTGTVIKSFPDYYLLDSDDARNVWTNKSRSFRIDENLYIKDSGINDTIYIVENMSLNPLYVFDFGKYKYPLGDINKEGRKKIRNVDPADAHKRYFRNGLIVGTPKYFFYRLFVPQSLPTPKLRPEINGVGVLVPPTGSDILAIFDRVKNTNILLDTDQHLQKGLINDINGGLSFIPRYYTGNNEVVDVWRADDMKEMLTEEYFATQTIKDNQEYEKLRELLKNLKEDDNPVIVIAKLK